MKKKYVYDVGGQVIINESEIITVYAEDEKEAKAKAVDEFCNDMRNSYNLNMTVVNEATLQKVIEIEPMWLDIGFEYTCSVCGKDNSFRTSYCPHCGTKMKNGVAL